MIRGFRSGIRSKEMIVVSLVVSLAAFFRLFQIDRVPPGMHFDEAFNIFDILRLLQGQFSIFFPANHGREPFFFYLSATAATIFGDQALTLRLTSAVIGIVTVFVFYGFARSLFHSRLIAAIAAFLLAISVWHIYYSRLGLRVILSVPLTLLTVGFFWRGLVRTPTVTTKRSHTLTPGSPLRPASGAITLQDAAEKRIDPGDQNMAVTPLAPPARPAQFAGQVASVIEGKNHVLPGNIPSCLEAARPFASLRVIMGPFFGRVIKRAGEKLFAILTPSLRLRFASEAPDTPKGRGAKVLATPTPTLSLKGERARPFALAGLCAALAVYTYTSGRLLPLVLIMLAGAASLLNWARWRDYLRGLAISGLVAFIVFIPLGYYFVTHPSDFFEHGSYLSIWDVRVNKGDVAGTFRDNLGLVAGMFVIRGDQEAFRNVPDHPVFDPLVGALFLVGLVMLANALVSRKSSFEQRLRAVLIAGCLIVFVSISVLSDAPPNFTRTLAAAPFAILLPAWAVGAVWDRMATVGLQRIGVVGVSGILFVSTMLAFNDYFINFAASPALYYAFNVRMFDVAQWANKNSAANQIYLAPLWYQDGTLALLTRKTTLKSFESRDTIVLPSGAAGKDALYAFPLEQENKATKLAERIGELATREDVFGSTGEKILAVYRVQAGDLPDTSDPLATLKRASELPQPQDVDRTAWGDKLELIGYSVGAADAPKRNLEVTLFIRALSKMSNDYTFSIKVRDAKERVWGQEDKWLGDNSYATTAMSAGDLVIEKFYPGLDGCAPAGNYRITLEAYDPKTNQLLETTEPGSTTVALGTTYAEASQGNLYENLEPDQTLMLDVATQMQLFGYSLTPGEIHAGDEFSLALFWRGQGSGAAARPVSVRLGDAVIGQKDVGLPSEGKGLCTLFNLRAPTGMPNGAAAIFVNDKKLTTVNVLR
jgi:dolichyl-phosphate-mannose-protein mannosyltransferase